LACLGAAGAVAPGLAACRATGSGAGALPDPGPIRIGLLVPQAGPYKTVGDDMTDGFQLYVKLAGGKFGGRRADIVSADEGDTAESGKAAARKLINEDRVSVLTGVANSAAMMAIKDDVQAAQIPLIGSNASPTGLVGVPYIWRTSFVNSEPGA